MEKLKNPLITLAIFSYNQEDYIKEAIESALSQTYQPLEIIISDDNSCDETFKIIKKMTEGYDGPHNVKALKSPENSGTLNHVLSVVEKMQGELLVLSAGDDISYPGRVEKIANLWITENCSAIFSSHDIIDENSEIIIENSVHNGSAEVISWFSFIEGLLFVHGATSAYDRKIFKGLTRSKNPIYTEDAIFSIKVWLEGGNIRFIKQPLVGYRQHEGAWSNAIVTVESSAEILRFENKKIKAACSHIALCDYVCDVLMEEEFDGKIEAKKRISKARRFAVVRNKIGSSSFKDRVTAVRISKKYREYRYLFPRFFGIELFSFVKFFIKSIVLKKSK